MSTRVKFSLLIVLFALAALLAYPREDLILKRLGFKNAKLSVKLGLDLQGGAHLVYQADFSKAGNINRNEAMNNLVEVIQKRMNPTGTSEIGVTVASGDRVIVELPGVKDVTQATALLGKTAELRFVEVPSGATSAEQFIETGISGKDIDRADPDYDTQKNEPIVRLRLKSGDATQRFADVTTRINQNGNRLLTLLDQDIVFGPATVSSPITDGTAQLQGNFTVTQAKSTAELINGGALPVPISLVEQRTVGPTLGRESVSRSLVAGLIGLGIVALFMLAYYRLAGLIAVSALVYYTALTAMLYKLSTLTPYTIVLTLAGIAGFILSIGMAVDANILIFERMKEELRAGKSFVAALEAGFDRAWSSIRDSNVSTLITCVILYNFGAPIIKGFAVTLGLGVVISMFTAVVVSRTFLRMLITTRVGRNPRLYGVTTVEEEAS
jgi:preprotein translocase subunit SecD